ncbi:D-alanyl-D-alanine carboxypeptidase/D-alanyl-D-alanine-endopeptidase [Synechococcus sp. CBW1108]|uniref:D-alanyl-D-alanine carboxypeptidase/D-alanyl-D-alanine endopeptidase n=1 Tax=Synechococcus sp. CBW1108 TaxID=1353147 RepID=UPI0018CD7B10|nr:D-alanyl-D-alanine carboxypeptidase/D-alanyl-D-alanine-endopeptidase [Synechococcus sp. CBW1108]QPN69635.1 D-alanyl-D-alanine carboxypeptidase/D-alanyl-D-alanine-endopeptidase [Synechococcus sp. CBW1108]
MAYPKPVRLLAALLLPAATLLPAAVIAQQGPETLATMPAAPPPIGLPQLQSQLSCPALQQRLLAAVGGQASVWSITIADSQGRLLADLNGSRPRIPASNQKLVSTAYALDRLGTDYRLSTQLWRLSDGSFRLTGEGDPDLALPQLQRFAKLALGSGGGSGQLPSLLKLQIAEEPRQSWWPQGWHPDDRYYAYGAPITRLALTSNAIHEAVMNPPSRLQNLLQKTMQQQGAKVQVSLISARAPLPDDAVLMHQENSAPMHNLLSLANTESHNFTAEVLLRQGAGSWDLGQAAQRETLWLAQQGLPMQGVRVVDGSGLDRANRLTSRFLAALLLRMDQHPYGRDYLASMAVAGKRGTLRNLYVGTPLQGKFYGKTGTITGVRAISGVLVTSDGPRYVSAISNGASSPNETIGLVLRETQDTRLCPP